MTVTEEKPSQSSREHAALQNILVATDFSEPAQRALCKAVRIAGKHHSRLSVVHVLHPDRQNAAFENPPELDKERIAAEQQLTGLVAAFEPGQAIATLLIKHGPVAEQVVSVIEQKGIDLLVIGTRGRGSLQTLALGSAAEELLRIAPCPVMTVGPRVELGADSVEDGFHTILFATDFGRGSAKALPIALALTRSQQGQLILLHVLPPVPVPSASLSAYAPPAIAAGECEEYEAASHKSALKKLKDFLPPHTGLAQEPKYVVGTDFLAEGILLASAEFKADLIVMGANRTVSPKIAAHLPWAAVHEVVRHAHCPVLTVVG